MFVNVRILRSRIPAGVASNRTFSSLSIGPCSLGETRVCARVVCAGKGVTEGGATHLVLGGGGACPRFGGQSVVALKRDLRKRHSGAGVSGGHMRCGRREEGRLQRASSLGDGNEGQMSISISFSSAHGTGPATTPYHP